MFSNFYSLDTWHERGDSKERLLREFFVTSPFLALITTNQLVILQTLQFAHSKARIHSRRSAFE